MRRSNWKIKVWFGLAVIIGIIMGIIAAFEVQKYNPALTGLAFFGVMIIVMILLVLVGAKILRIGEE